MGNAQAPIHEYLQDAAFLAMGNAQAPIHEYLARRDLDAYVAALVESAEPGQRLKLRAAAVYAPAPVNTHRGWFGSVTETPVALPGGLQRHIRTMSELHVRAEVRTLLERSVKLLRVDYTTTATTLGVQLQLHHLAQRQRLEQLLETFVLLHVDLVLCRAVGDTFLSDKTKMSSKCTSVALIQAAAVVCGSPPSQPALEIWTTPPKHVATILIEWRLHELLHEESCSGAA